MKSSTMMTLSLGLGGIDEGRARRVRAMMDVMVGLDRACKRISLPTLWESVIFQ